MTRSLRKKHKESLRNALQEISTDFVDADQAADAIVELDVLASAIAYLEWGDEQLLAEVPSLSEVFSMLAGKRVIDRSHIRAADRLERELGRIAYKIEKSGYANVSLVSINEYRQEVHAVCQQIVTRYSRI